MISAKDLSILNFTLASLAYLIILLPWYFISHCHYITINEVIITYSGFLNSVKKVVFGYRRSIFQQSCSLYYISVFSYRSFLSSSLNRVCWHPWTALIELWVALFQLESHSWLELQPGRSKNCHRKQILKTRKKCISLYPITYSTS